MADGTLSAYRWRSVQDQNKENLYAFRSLLEQDQGITQDVSLKVPVDPALKLLIITGNPRFEENERYNFDQFLMRGGRALLMLRAFDFNLDRMDPNMAQMGIGQQGGGFALVNQEDLKKVNDWIAPYGMLLRPEILLEPEFAVRTLDIQGQYVGQIPNPAWALYSADTGNLNKDHIITKFSQQVVFPYFSGLDLREAVQSDVMFTAIVKSSSSAVSRESSSLNIKDLQNTGGVAGEEPVSSPVPVAVFAEGKFKSAFENNNEISKKDKNIKSDNPAGPSTDNAHLEVSPADASIMILGSPYLVSDLLVQNEVSVQAFQINQAFLLNTAESMLGDEDLIAARSRVMSMSMFTGPGPAAEWIFTVFHILFIPSVIAVYGFIRLYRRNAGRGM
jgi:ABC-type uncharacterized transport system involved in gliding motility auxiliary subunit